MALHRFSPTKFWNTLGTHPPALKIANGDTVVALTVDAHGFDRSGKQVGRDPNPMTGPFFVEGAEAGDMLRVRIDTIDMVRPSGWTRAGLSPAVVDPAFVPTLPARDKINWHIDINQGRVSLEAAPEELRDWSLPVEPMIGCFGVAPEDGQSISTATSGRYGGNMDYRGFRAGTTAMFPVSAEGALLFLGDVHGRQGDGEIAGTGIETAAEVTFTVELVKGKTIGWPRGETADEIFCVGNARPLDQALQHATTEMLRWLTSDYRLNHEAACHAMGMGVRYAIANVFNPAYSVVCRMEKQWLP
jgi:acetamidase/formamidase